MTALPTLYQQQIHLRHYARWSDELRRRETWDETVDRYVQQQKRQAVRYGSELTVFEEKMIRDAISSTGVMPSMRQLMTAGPALERDNVAGYNCAYVSVNHPRAFDETLFILCCGTGIGFSVERQFIAKLPEVPSSFEPGILIDVDDSKEGWADAFRQLIDQLYNGQDPRWTTHRVRKAGERLKVFGGRSSGPGPLEDLFRYTVQVFKGATGRRLTSSECHLIMCKIGDIVVVGGVRRSAMISLYNPSDDRMSNIKSGNGWGDLEPHLRLANNSAAWTEKPDIERFLEHQWLPLIKGKSGEPGIVNRAAFIRKAAENGRREINHDFGCNPCGEIILRSMEFCNLTEVVARPEDDFDSLIHKVRVATMMGVIQSTYTNFRYIRDEWRKNCEEERLLGVSITGVVDNALLNGEAGDAELRSTLHALKHVAIDTAAEWAERLGISMSVAITCNKPSGTVAKLVLSGAGINEWHSKYFIQRQRAHKSDPAAQVMYMAGVHCEDDIMDPDNTWVFSWPTKAPEGALTRDDMPAIKKLKLWLAYAEMWCEHNPSTTINVREDEWMEAGAFVYEHFDRLAGIAFLPHVGHIYQQAPYEEITEEQYEAMMRTMPDTIDWGMLAELEFTDHTEGAKELACAAGQCAL